MRKRYIILLLLAVFFMVVEYTLRMRISDSKAISEFNEKGIKLGTRTLHIKGREMHYVSVGSDTMRTIVFVHGSPGSWQAFEGYLEDSALRRTFRMISIDRPGYGYSSYGQALPFQEDCDMISALLDSVKNGKPMYLVGHSLGGSIVPVLAADNPGMVSGVIVLAGALDPAMEHKEAWRYPFTLIPLRYLMPGAMRQSNDELWYFKTDILKLREKLARIKCRVYILHAANDALVDVRNVDYMKKAFTSAQVSDTIFTDGNHFIPWNHKDCIRKILLEL